MRSATKVDHGHIGGGYLIRKQKRKRGDARFEDLSAMARAVAKGAMLVEYGMLSGQSQHYREKMQKTETQRKGFLL